MGNADTISLLNRLIVTELNGEASLRAAAEEAHHPELRTALMAYSHCLGDNARQLQEEVRALGGSPSGTGTVGNTMHRTWMHLKAVAFGRNEDVILGDVEADEQEAETMLADAVTWNTPPGVHDVLQRQYDEVARRHREVRALHQRLH